MTRRNAETEKQETFLMVSRDEAKEKGSRQIEKGKHLSTTRVQTQEQLRQTKSRYKTWRDYTTELLSRLFSTDELAKEFSYIGGGFLRWGPVPLEVDTEDFRTEVRRDLDRLTSIFERIELFPVHVVQQHEPPDALTTIETLAMRFHLVARQLRRRHTNRATLDITDEYDVQDLLHALLTLFFDEIRPEEWVPSYAGGASRMDFLLKSERIVIEAKKTRQGFGGKAVGDELLIDIGRYEAHPDCRILVCFVYDPDGYIANPTGLESDLNRVRENLEVKCIVSPKGH